MTDEDPPIISAVNNSDLELARASLLSDPSSINHQSADHALDTPLHLAVRRDDLSMVEFLIDQQDIDLMLRNGSGETASALAARLWREEIAKLLLRTVAKKYGLDGSGPPEPGF